MRKIIKNILTWLSFACILIPVIFLFVIRFKNIDMTETRLLVTYWKEIVALVVIMLGAYTVLDKIVAKL